MLGPDLGQLPAAAREKMGATLEMSAFLAAQSGEDSLEALVVFAAPPTDAELAALGALCRRHAVVGAAVVSALIPLAALGAVLGLPAVARLEASGHAPIA